MKKEETPREDQSRGAKSGPDENHLNDITSVRRFEWERALRASQEVYGPRMLTLLVLATYLDLDGTGRLGIAKIVSALKINERTVRRHLDWAEAAGWIRRTQHPGRTCAFTLTTPDIHTTPDTQMSGVTTTTPDTQMSGGADIQMSGGADIQMSYVQSSSQGPLTGPQGGGQTTNPKRSAGATRRGPSDNPTALAVKHVQEQTGRTWEEAAAYVADKLDGRQVANPLGYVKTCVAKDQATDSITIPAGDDDSSWSIEIEI